MGFVTLEDIQGNIELVLFPRTWQKTREQLTVGQIIIVEGKVDTGSTPPKILVDEVKTEIKILEPLHASTKAPLVTKDLPASKPEPDPLSPLTQQPEQNTDQKKIPVKPSIPPPVRQIAENDVAGYESPSSGGWDDMPPPPDNFPEDWDSEWQPSFENAEIAARPEPKVNPQPAVSEPRLQQTESIEIEIRHDEQGQIEAARETVIVQPIGLTQTETKDFLPSLYIPLAQEETDKDHLPQQITVTLRSTGDKERDKRRIKTIFGTLISFHGKDRFSFQIFENGKGHLIDFPNDTTRVCTEVLERLKKLIGEENWRVEEITFQ
jgi:DNA polymerase-3 subunit alpha